MTVRSTRGAAVLTASILALGASACASGGGTLDLPPVTPDATGVRHPGQFVWHDLVTDDVEAAKSFYGALFGWRFEDVRSEAGLYSTVRRDGRAIGGIVAIDDANADVASARWLPLMSVEDVDAAIMTVTEAGGSVLAGPRDNPTRGRMVLVADPQGALVVLVRSLGGDPPNRNEGEVGAGDWLWTELWARDAGDAASFYASLVDYAVERPATAMPPEYRVFRRDGQPRAGVNELPWDEVLPNWLSYIRVADPVAVAAEAERLGGVVLIPPDPQLRGGSVALLMDPTGAAFAVQRWPMDGAGTPGGAR